MGVQSAPGVLAVQQAERCPMAVATRCEVIAGAGPGGLSRSLLQAAPVSPGPARAVDGVPDG